MDAVDSAVVVDRHRPGAVSVAVIQLYLLAFTAIGASLLDAAAHRQGRVVADLVVFFGYAVLAIRCGDGGRLVRLTVRVLCLAYGVSLFSAVSSGEAIGVDRVGVPRWYFAGITGIIAGGLVLLAQVWVLLDRRSSVRYFECARTSLEGARRAGRQPGPVVGCDGFARAGGGERLFEARRQ